MALDDGMSHGDLSVYEMTFGISTEGNKATRTSAIIKHIFDDEQDTDRYVIDLLNHLCVETAGADHGMEGETFANLNTKVLQRLDVRRTSDGYEMPDGSTSMTGTTPQAPADQLPLPSGMLTPPTPNARKRVVVIYGQDEAARTAMFTFLRSLHLQPLEFETIVNESGEGSPFTGAAIDLAFTRAQAIVALITPDEWAALHPELGTSTRRLQARPNVIFEAGLAIGRLPTRTILVKYGTSELWSDMDGRHYVAIDNTSRRRQSLRDRLEQTGCVIENVGSDYLTAPAGGDFGPFSRAP